MSVFNWSQTSANNASADPTINYSEGQAPSSLNDSARAAMAAVAKYRDDIAGAIVTAGTSTAYTVTSYSVFDTLAHLDGQMIAFTPHVTNGANPTLNVDGLGARGIVSASGVSIPAGTLIANTPYVATYNNSNTEFRLHGFYGNPYNIPLGATIEWWLNTPPNSSFVLPYGQAISRTTYASLYALFGTTYGSGDGSTTFNIPDLRGRVVACPDVMGASTDANRLTGMPSRTAVGTGGGEAQHTLAVIEMPSHYHGINWSDPGHNHQLSGVTGYQISGASNLSLYTIPGTVTTTTNGTGITFTGAGGANTTQAEGSGSPHNNIQPTILANRIMRVI